MHLESANILQFQFVGGSTEIAAELRNRADVGSLCRWRKIADGHVLDHALAQRADGDGTHGTLLSEIDDTSILRKRPTARHHCSLKCSPRLQKSRPLLRAIAAAI